MDGGIFLEGVVVGHFLWVSGGGGGGWEYIFGGSGWVDNFYELVRVVGGIFCVSGGGCTFL